MTAASPAPVLSVAGLSKSFGENRALDGVDLIVRSGEIHALVGMNGSGKSTIVKILSGFYTADAGEVTLTDAGRLAFVHQDLGLIGSMSVVDNLSLSGAVPPRAGVIHRAGERERAHRLLEPFGLEDLIDVPVDLLTRAEATIVAIARALDDPENPPACLVLDEPTSTLPAEQTAQLLGVMAACAASGIGIMFISHRLTEVLAVSDTVTVLRSGRVSASESAADLTVGTIVHAMGAADAEPALPEERAHQLGDVLLEADSVTGRTMRDVSLSARSGEVVGIIGLLGSGIEEIGGILSGRAPVQSGTIMFDGWPLTRRSAHAIGFVPADRPRQGVLGGLSARENASIIGLQTFVRRGAISASRERRRIGELFRLMRVHPPDPEQPMLSLSGGNQQKVLFARWLLVEPRVLIADEPTQGIDLHAKSQILTRLREYAAGGRLVVLISGEPEEIAPACDRLLVIEEGNVVAELARPFTTEQIATALHERTTRVPHH